MSSPSALADHLFGSTTPPPLPTATAMLLDDQDNDAEDGDLFGDDQDDDEEMKDVESIAEGSVKSEGNAQAAASQRSKGKQEEDEEEDDDSERGNQRRARDDDEDDDDLSEDERARRRAQEYPEEENKFTASRETTSAAVDLINCGLPAESKVWHARLPTYLALVKTAFDPRSEATWADPTEIDVKPKVDDGETVRGEKAGDEDKIRWRWNRDQATQEVVKQSNSRVVRWSDGSLSLQIGSEHYAISAALDHSAAILPTPSDIAPPPPSSSTAGIPLSSFDSTRAHGLTHLTAQHPYISLIESQASIHGTLTFRPMTTQGKTHRRLAGNIAVKYVKAKGIRQTLAKQDPERAQREREQADAEKRKAEKKAEMAKRGGFAKGKRGPKRSVRLLLGSDDEDGEDREDGEDDDDDDDEGTQRRSNPKRGRGGPLDRVRSDDEDEDDGFVVSGSDEDVPEKVGKGSRRKLGDVKGGEMDDAVTEAEARIERDEKRRRKQVQEEEDDEPVMGIKRRLVVPDDEDDE